MCVKVYVSVLVHRHAFLYVHSQGVLFVLAFVCSVCVGLCTRVTVHIFMGFSKSALIFQFCNRINPIFESLYCRDDRVLYFVVTRDR